MNPASRIMCVLLLAVGTVCLTAPADAADLAPGAERAARDFLTAFILNDRAAIRALLPKNAADLYGPCPFTKMPQILKPRADGRIGAVDFAGPTMDPNLPQHGIMVLRLVEEGSSKSWKVRQIYWFTDLPPEANIPDKSPTAADRRQEPAVRRAAIEFISAWTRKNWEALGDLTFEWWDVHRRPPKWVKLVKADFEGKPTTLEGVRVDFDATLRFARLLPKHVHGSLWLVKEDGAWRVRPITLSLLF